MMDKNTETRRLLLMRQYEPTEKQKQYLLNRAKGMERREALLAAGYADTKGNLHKLEHNPRLQEWLANSMEQSGITAETIMQTVAKGLAAKKNIRVVQDTKNPDVYVNRKTADHDARLNAIMVALSLTGSLPPYDPKQGRHLQQSLNGILDDLPSDNWATLTLKACHLIEALDSIPDGILETIFISDDRRKRMKRVLRKAQQNRKIG